MSLEVKKSIKRYLPKIIFWTIVVILAGILIKVALWEKHYYESKEGSEREAPILLGDVISTEEEVSTDEVTPEEVKAYTVAPEKPRYLSVERLGIVNARIVEVGVNGKGQMGTPRSIYDAAWYNKSSLPGTGGTAILDGHNGGPNVKGIFKQLNLLRAGDIISIEMGNGTVYQYKVYDNFEVSLSEANSKMSMLQSSPIEGTESISIISCIGEYSLSQKTYLSRQFLRATKI